jgi:hypothetical protein
MTGITQTLPWWLGGGEGGRGKDDRKQNSLVPLVHRMGTLGFCYSYRWGKGGHRTANEGTVGLFPFYVFPELKLCRLVIS